MIINHCSFNMSSLFKQSYSNDAIDVHNIPFLHIENDLPVCKEKCKQCTLFLLK